MAMKLSPELQAEFDRIMARIREMLNRRCGQLLRTDRR